MSNNMDLVINELKLLQLRNEDLEEENHKLMKETECLRFKLATCRELNSVLENIKDSSQKCIAALNQLVSSVGSCDDTEFEVLKGSVELAESTMKQWHSRYEQLLNDKKQFKANQKSKDMQNYMTFAQRQQLMKAGKYVPKPVTSPKLKTSPKPLSNGNSSKDDDDIPMPILEPQNVSAKKTFKRPFGQCISPPLSPTAPDKNNKIDEAGTYRASKNSSKNKRFSSDFVDPEDLEDLNSMGSNDSVPDDGHFLDKKDREYVPSGLRIPAALKKARKSIGRPPRISTITAGDQEIPPPQQRSQECSPTEGSPKLVGGKYKCVWVGCGFISRYKQNVERHFRIHTGERPFKCGFKGCSFAATQAGNLKVHQQRHHYN